MSGEDTINAAFKFLQHVYRIESPFNGIVRFDITDSATGSFVKYICVTTEGGVQVTDGTLDAPANCNIRVDRVVLLAILTGTLDPAVALLWGQLAVDNLAVMSEFAKSFDLSPERFTDFQLSMVTEGAQPDGADMIPPVPMLHDLGSDPHDLNQKVPLKQALAIQTLHMLATCKRISKDLDSLITRVKEKDTVKKAFDNLDAKLEEFQATPTYKNLQSNAVYVTLRTELERATIGATIVGNRAKDVGEELVGKIATVAYPPHNHTHRINNVVSVAATGDGEAVVDLSAVKVDVVIDKKEQKRLQLLEKLERLKQHNKEMSEERAQRLASKR